MICEKCLNMGSTQGWAPSPGRGSITHRFPRMPAAVALFVDFEEGAAAQAELHAVLDGADPPTRCLCDSEQTPTGEMWCRHAIFHRPSNVSAPAIV
jgi:hypothetical protein